MFRAGGGLVPLEAMDRLLRVASGVLKGITCRRKGQQHEQNL